MTIYDALSQEYGLLIYHDYLLDNNCEQLADMCLINVIEFYQFSWQQATRRMHSRSGTLSGSLTMSQTMSSAATRSVSFASSWVWIGSRSQASSLVWIGSRSQIR